MTNPEFSIQSWFHAMLIHISHTDRGWECETIHLPLFTKKRWINPWFNHSSSARNRAVCADTATCTPCNFLSSSPQSGTSSLVWFPWEWYNDTGQITDTGQQIHFNKSFLLRVQYELALTLGSKKSTLTNDERDVKTGY